MVFFRVPELNHKWNFLSSTTWSRKNCSGFRNLIKIFFEFPEDYQEVFGVGVNLEILLKKIVVWILNVHLLSRKKKPGILFGYWIFFKCLVCSSGFLILINLWSGWQLQMKQQRWGHCVTRLVCKYHKKLHLEVEWKPFYAMLLSTHFKRCIHVYT